MSKQRPYEFVPTCAILILINEYAKAIREGDFKKNKDYELMLKELDIRFFTIKENNKQISIEEYMRSRKNGRK